jgi:hypothetical protein
MSTFKFNKKNTEKYKNKRSRRRIKYKTRIEDLAFITTRSGKRIPRKHTSVDYGDDDVFETIIEDDTVRATSQRLFGLYLLLTQSPTETKPGWLFPANYSEWKNIYDLAVEKRLTEVKFKPIDDKFVIYIPDLYDAYVIGSVLYSRDRTLVWNKRVKWWSECGDLADFGTIEVYPYGDMEKGDERIYLKPEDSVFLAKRVIRVPSLFYSDPYFVKLVSDDEVAQVFLENFIWNLMHAYIGKEGFELIANRKHELLTELMPLDEAMHDAFFTTMKLFKEAREKQANKN